MSKNDIQKKLFGLISDITKQKIELTSTLKELNIDSLDILDLVVKAENLFEMEFSDDEIVNLKTVEDIINNIDEKLN